MNRAELLGAGRVEAASLATTRTNTIVGILGIFVTLFGVGVTAIPGALPPAAAATATLPPLVRLLIVLVSVVMAGHVHVSSMGWIRRNATRGYGSSTSGSLMLSTLSGAAWAWAAFVTASVFFAGSGWWIVATLLPASGLVLRMLHIERHQRVLFPQGMLFLFVFACCWAII